jgi:hypothetical protein
MLKLDQTQEVVSMALTLKLDPRRGAVTEIIRYCRERIAGFVSKAGRVTTLDQLQSVLCKYLHLVFEEVWTDEDLDNITKKYVEMGELGFASLRMQLEDDTFATLMERNNVKASSPDRYIAVIDCRGSKAARRFFTRWHEIAHLLTPHRQLELPFHRSTSTSDDPIERLMDIVAGEIGFYSPIFEPVLQAELKVTGRLTFDGIQRVRDQVCPEASFQATMFACVKRSPNPIILLEAGMAYRKAEAREVGSGQLSMFNAEKPKPKLRAVLSTPNQAARDANFIIHKNMSVPSASLVAAHFSDSEHAQSSQSTTGEEELSIWRPSTGLPVGYGKVHVEARCIGGTLMALIQRSGLPRMKAARAG